MNGTNYVVCYQIRQVDTQGAERQAQVSMPAERTMKAKKKGASDLKPVCI